VRGLAFINTDVPTVIDIFWMTPTPNPAVARTNAQWNTTMTAATARLALSLSGGGHLLPYHLAVCETLLDASKLEKIPPIEAISGSSAGTIAATVSCRLPSHCLSEFAEKFIQQRGHGLKLLKEFLSPKNDREHLPRLHVCTTRCSDGTAHVLSEKDLDTREKLLTCVQASCTIPRSFHPMDVLESSGSLVYPDSDGILIDGCDIVVVYTTTLASLARFKRNSRETYTCQEYRQTSTNIRDINDHHLSEQ
jgi:predicted acylesterase/phospholipase RssA